MGAFEKRCSSEPQGCNCVSLAVTEGKRKRNSDGVGAMAALLG